MLKTVTTSLVLLAPTLAFACPTSADLSKGIRVLSPGGEIETFTKHNENIVKSEFFFEPGEGTRGLLAQGMYVVELIDIYGGTPDLSTRATFTFPVAPGEMPDPAPGAIWSSNVTILDKDGVSTDFYDIRFGAQTSMTIGACGYDMIPAVFSFPMGDESVETLYFLPKLGISLLGSVQEKDKELETYLYSDIQTVK